jgi:hypothetical protein
MEEGSARPGKNTTESSVQITIIGSAQLHTEGSSSVSQITNISIH